MHRNAKIVQWDEKQYLCVLCTCNKTPRRQYAAVKSSAEKEREKAWQFTHVQTDRERERERGERDCVHDASVDGEEQLKEDL